MTGRRRTGAARTHGSDQRPAPPAFPQTRYQGSKRRLADVIIEALEFLAFDNVLDAFSGTASVGFAFKRRGKAVTCNDLLAFNHQVAVALVENDVARIRPAVVDRVIEGRDTDPFIECHFDGIYFTGEENRWLDRAAAAVRGIRCRYVRAMAWFALFQAALAKRPYNLFHRANLYMRTADVPRSFGNKATWDRPFTAHFRSFAEAANEAVFAGGAPCAARRGDVLEVEGPFDLVYVDPPYVSAAGSSVDYRDFYHFLEGLMLGAKWEPQIDWSSRHRRLQRVDNPWNDPRRNDRMFAGLFERFADSHLAVSYRSDGLPSIDDLRALLGRFKRRVEVIELRRNQYALSTRRGTHEMLLVGYDP